MKSIKEYVGDVIPTEYCASNYTFNVLNDKYKDKTGSKDDLTVKHLMSTKLITEDNKLTIAGMYFCDNSPEGYPAIHLRKWPGFDKGSDEVIDAKEIRTNIIDQLHEAEKFIRSNSKTGIVKQPGGAKNRWSYPPIAVTEALCIAIGYRDYSITGAQIDVDIYPDRMVIVSPDNFLPDGRAQDYEDMSMIPSKRRNDAITDTLAMCNLMQRYGSGFEKIVKAYEPYDKKYQPKVVSEKGWFVLILMDVTYVEEERIKVCDIDLPRVQKIVYEAIMNNPGIRKPMICKVTELSDMAVKRAIDYLRDKELVCFEGSAKNGGYYINNKVCSKE